MVVIADVTIDGHNINYTETAYGPQTSFPFVINFRKTNKKSAMIPNWVNRPESVDSYFWNKSLIELEYTYRATDDEKWDMDQSLRAHVKVEFSDYIHNLFSTDDGGVWISKVNANWDHTNWERPWKVTVTLLVMASELEEKSSDTTFESLCQDASISDNLGAWLIDGEDAHNGSGINPFTYHTVFGGYLAYGMHDINFVCPAGQHFVEWASSGDCVIIDQNNDYQTASCTIFIYGPTMPWITAVYEKIPIFGLVNIDLDSISVNPSYNFIDSSFGYAVPALDKTLYPVIGYLNGGTHISSFTVQATAQDVCGWYHTYNVRLLYADGSETDVNGLNADGTVYDLKTYMGSDHYKFLDRIIITWDSIGAISYSGHITGVGTSASSSHLGVIQIDAMGYGLPITAQVAPTDHPITFFADDGWAFAYWETDGGVIVDDPYASSTTMHVAGDGLLYAHYVTAPYNIGLYSNIDGITRPDDSIWITLNNVEYFTPTTGYQYYVCFCQLTCGNSLPPCGGQYYMFDHWETTGGVSVDNPCNQTTNLVCTGSGTLTAYFTLKTVSEFIQNGGFEDSTHMNHWTSYETVVGSSSQYHSGGWSAYFGADGCNASMFQDLAIHEAVNKIASFGFWSYSDRYTGTGSVWQVTVTYEDDTYDSFPATPSDYHNWKYVDILPHLTAGKVVKRVKILSIPDSGWAMYVDDVSLQGY